MFSRDRNACPTLWAEALDGHLKKGSKMKGGQKNCLRLLTVGAMDP